MPPETVDSVEFVQRGSEASPRLTDRATAMCAFVGVERLGRALHLPLIDPTNCRLSRRCASRLQSQALLRRLPLVQRE
ncbi:unnamed protein product [Lasius platythorax]|uniref:Uncharacterized protein n=1 Tax=Lasius platythorax TaxID=488582 RepID=A0AAV2P357_9HYME